MPLFLILKLFFKREKRMEGGLLYLYGEIRFNREMKDKQL